MLEYDDRNDFINDNFHGPSTSQFSRFVVVDSTMNALKRNVSPVAKRLLGNDINKIMQVNHAIEHLDQLIAVRDSVIKANKVKDLSAKVKVKARDKSREKGDLPLDDMVEIKNSKIK